MDIWQTLDETPALGDLVTEAVDAAMAEAVDVTLIEMTLETG